MRNWMNPKPAILIFMYKIVLKYISKRGGGGGDFTVYMLTFKKHLKRLNMNRTS